MAAASPDLAARIAARIAGYGPITVAEFMGLANAHYYATRDPLGAAGDFTTAPEISQMFGELTGAWLADLWIRAGRPARAAYVELGPGRGTLAADALRVMAKAGLAPAVHFVETSPVLRAAQRERAPQAVWHDAIATLPADGPLLIVANEFFDALPVRQFVATSFGWRERMVTRDGASFAPVPGDTPCDAAIPAPLRGARPGSVVETCPAGQAIAAAIAERLTRQSGAALIVDYGYAGFAAGDTFQAVRAHAYADPFARPGEQDLTAHVDFDALAEAAQGMRVHGPVDQRFWLEALGIAARAAALSAAAPNRAAEIAAARHRLTDDEQMGALFKVLALSPPGWPEPIGFGDD